MNDMEGDEKLSNIIIVTRPPVRSPVAHWVFRSVGQLVSRLGANGLCECVRVESWLLALPHLARFK